MHSWSHRCDWIRFLLSTFVLHCTTALAHFLLFSLVYKNPCSKCLPFLTFLLAPSFHSSSHAQCLWNLTKEARIQGDSTKRTSKLILWMLSAISQDLLNQLSFFEQYSAAAYCPANNEPGSSTAIVCDVGNCPLVQSAGAQSILEFEK